MSSKTVTLGEYLFTRLRQLGVGSIFGVPGDYNLRLLDYVEPSGLTWIGTCNELNAGYATDGYARIKGLGALITTFGVGELSAVNAIAGAYTELVPVVHIVGTPVRQVQDSRALVHHTLCDGEFGRFSKMYEQVTVAQVDLRDLSTCTEQVDWVLKECLRTSRPVYIRLPDDMAVARVSAERLSTVTVTVPGQRSPADIEDRVMDLVLERIYSSKKPAILIDGESRAFGILQEIDHLVKATGWPTWTTGFGKGLVDESLPNVLGIYQGKIQKSQRAYFDTADLVLNFGPHHSQTNTYFGSNIPNPNITIAFGQNNVIVDGQDYQDLSAKRLLSRLVGTIDRNRSTISQAKIDADLEYRGEVTSISATQPVSTPLDQTHMWPMFNSLIKSGDVVFCETGTAAFGARCFKLPPKAYFVTSVTWLSIGYMLPASLGSAQAQRELASARKDTPNGVNNHHQTTKSVSPRTFLFIGDGSLQTTVQEISTMIAQKLNITVIIINNDGYTIERCIHGRKQKYNDIVEWNYLKAPELFSRHGLNDPNYPVHTFTAKTFGDLQSLVDNELTSREPGFTMLEVFLQREDAPMYLRTILDQQVQAEPTVT